jgi:hypothetical protein
MILEPKEVNSGTPQGNFLKRRQILKEDGSGIPLLPFDFKIGRDVIIFPDIYESLIVINIQESSLRLMENLKEHPKLYPLIASNRAKSSPQDLERMI